MKKVISSLLPVVLGYMLSQAQNPLIIPDTLSGNSINLDIHHSSRQFYAGVQTQTMGINGDFLAPTLILNRGQQVSMHVTNNLSDTTTIHWHGMHVAPENDGGPHIYILPGTTWSPSFEVMDNASTHWYHPHLHHKTYEHVQFGIAGLIIVRDSQEAALALPRTYGIDDIPLVIQSRGFDANKQIIATHTASDSVLMVNGTIKPFVSLPAQVVRLRLLNGSPERIYNVGFSDNRSFRMIGSDGGLLEAPVSLTRLMLAPGERAEILVDLGSDNGQSLAVMNYGSEIPAAIYGSSQPGMGPGLTIAGYSSNPLNGSDNVILTVNVGSPTSHAITTFPASLVPLVRLQASDADTTRSFVLTPEVMGPTALNGPFMINGSHFDMDVINEEVPLDNIEIWELRNQSPIAHPFHIHNTNFYILSVNGATPSPQLQGKKDVVLVPAGNSVVRFIAQFKDFYNDSLPYMYHCHMLSHEDDGMMGQFVVKKICNVSISNPANLSVNSGGNAQFSVSVTDTAGVAYQWQSDTGGGFTDLSEGGQFSGVHTATLLVQQVNASNSNQVFRCLITHPCRNFISGGAVLNVIQTPPASDGLCLVYPDPASDIINIRSDDITAGSYRLVLYDALGRRLRELQQPAGNKILSVRNLPPGEYFIRLTGSGKNCTLRFVKG